MILFCDTSALVKLYVVETDSALVKRLVADADAVAVSRIAWAEFHAAAARRRREQPAVSAALELAQECLAQDWPKYVVMEITQTLVEHAGELADAFTLRAYDAVQLAAAHIAMEQSGLPFGFACFDRRLNRAAKLLGLGLPIAGQG